MTEDSDSKSKQDVTHLSAADLSKLRDAISSQFGHYLKPGETMTVDAERDPVKCWVRIEVAKADGTPVKFHKVQKGETYWSIAAREYGDGSLATKLQDYNKAVSPDAAKLALNSDLRIPPIDVPVTSFR